MNPKKILFILISLLITVSVQADTVFFQNGGKITGTIEEITPESDSVIVLSSYGKQQFYKKQIIVCLNDKDAKIVNSCLACARTFLNKNQARQAHEQFDIVMDIDPGFEGIIKRYLAEHNQHLRVVATKRLTAPIPPIIPSFEEAVVPMLLDSTWVLPLMHSGLR